MRHAGADLVLAADRGLLEAADEVHLAAAHGEARVIVTQDADFLDFHQRGIAHSGIVYFPQGTGIGHIVQQLILLFEVYSATEMMGRVEFL